jgi:protein-disulfide isomerase
VAFIFFPLLSYADPASDERSLGKQIEQLLESQKAIEKDLQEIKAFLRGAAPPNNVPAENVVLGVNGNQFKGHDDAKLVVVEFSDYECPFCGRYFNETWPMIQKEFISAGKIKYVVRDFPLQSVHPNAVKAAEAAGCAAKQGKYWEMHDRLFQYQNQLGAEELPKHAEAIGLDKTSFEQCLSSGTQVAAVRNTLEEGIKAGVQGTPTFFLGVQNGDGQSVKVIQAIVGAQPYITFKEKIDAALSQISK